MSASAVLASLLALAAVGPACGGDEDAPERAPLIAGPFESPYACEREATFVLASVESLGAEGRKPFDPARASVRLCVELSCLDAPLGTGRPATAEGRPALEFTVSLDGITRPNSDEEYVAAASVRVPGEPAPRFADARLVLLDQPISCHAIGCQTTCSPTRLAFDLSAPAP